MLGLLGKVEFHSLAEYLAPGITITITITTMVTLTITIYLEEVLIEEAGGDDGAGQVHDPAAGEHQQENDDKAGQES